MKNLKKLISIMLLFVLVAGVYGCGSKKPSDVVTTYFEEIKKGTNGEFDKLFTNTLNKSEKTENAYDESTKKLITSMNKITYKINSEKVEGDSATVNVTLNGPEFSKVFGEFMKKAMADALSKAFSEDKATEEENNKLYDKMLCECIDNMTYAERTGDIKLTKTNGEWKIDNDDSLGTLLLGMDMSAFNKINDNN